MFIKTKLAYNSNIKGKMTVLHNFSYTSDEYLSIPKENYVLYFGRYSEEKGIATLIEACKRLADITFVFAGRGSLESEINTIQNIENVGFMNGTELYTLIRKARFSIYPSEWHENCPFSVIESISLGTPVIGANTGGIPELIKNNINGILFKSGNIDDLTCKIRLLWDDANLNKEFENQCSKALYYSISDYGEKVIEIYNS